MPKRCEVQLYQEDGWTSEKIIEVLAGRGSVKEYAFILHDKDVDEKGQLKKPHYHIFLGFGNNTVQLPHVAGWFGIKVNLVSYIKSTKYSTLLYFLHVNQPEKHRYRVEDMEANFDVSKFLESMANEKNLNKILSLCAVGTINRWNYTDAINEITYAKHKSKIENAFSYYEQKKVSESHGRRNLTVYWMYGKTECGKTTLAYMYAEQKGLPIYITASGKDPFSNYKNQPVVLLDDLRPGTMEYEELLKLLDPHYSSPVKSRYYNKNMDFCEVLFISTVYSPEEFCRLYYLDSIDSDKQLFRRLTEVWMVDRYIVEISEYLSDSNAFEMIHQIRNPVRTYLEKLGPAVAGETGFDVLSEMNGRYADAINAGENSMDASEHMVLIPDESSMHTSPFYEIQADGEVPWAENTNKE